MPAIRIAPDVAIEDDEIELSFSRSGGPGGQHANTSSTRVDLRFDVAHSPSLTEAQRTRARQRLGPRLTGDGVLTLSASEERSQTRNREAALARFTAIMRDALAPPPPPRRPTRPTAASRRERLDSKRRRGQTKTLRRRVNPD
jgi:ribosome-associated protein